MLVLFDAACVAFLLALILSPPVRSLSVRLGIVDHPDSSRKFHSHPIPRVGGVAVALAYGLTLAFVSIAPYHNVPFDVGGTLANARRLLPAALVLLATGILDDWRGLKPRYKLVGQIAAAVLAYNAGFGVEKLFDHQLQPWISLPLTVLWLVTCTNAFNLIDGVDGLAAGLGFFATLTMMVAALTYQNLELALVTAPLAGSLLGFLRYNFNPATIFLGDSGSLLLGFLLGCYGAMWSHKAATLLAITAPLMALALPLFEVALSVVRRFIRRQPIFGADRGHMHHRLLDRGMPPRRAALLMYAVAGLLAALSVLQQVASDKFGGVILVLFCAGSWIGVQHLGYGEFGLAGRLVFGGGMRRMIDVQLRLQQLERSLETVPGLEEAEHLIRASAVNFGFREVQFESSRHPMEEFARISEPGCWHIRVPITSGYSVTLYRNPEAEVHPVAFSAFAGVVEQILKTKLTGAESSVANTVQTELGETTTRV